MKKVSKITSSHYILPSKVLKNEDLLDRFDEKKLKGISKLSGIYERRVAPENVTAVDLGTECAQRMIDSLNVDKSSIDMIIFVSSTPDYILPPSSYVIHKNLGLQECCGAFDVPMGCPALPYSLSIANGLIASGQSKKILLIIADTVTKLLNPKDRGLVTLHGDGSASFIIEKSKNDFGIESIELFADSSNWDKLLVPAGGMRKRCSEKTKIDFEYDNGSFVNDENLQMNGAAVFHFGISTIPNAIKNFMKKHDIGNDDISLLLLHQANKMMLDQIYRTLNIESYKQFFFMEKIGNLGAASSPVLLAEALRTKKINHLDRVLSCAFGVGLSWGICSIKFENPETIASRSSTEF